MWFFINAVLLTCHLIVGSYSKEIPETTAKDTKDTPIFRYDYNYYDEIQGWLKVHTIPENWYDARIRCKLEGAEIASPVDRPMKEAMMKCGKGNVREVFTGIHSLFSLNDYFSVNGVPLEKMLDKWAPRSPSAEDTKRCVVLFNLETISNEDCESERFPYFCYKKNTFEPITDCGTVDTEYKYVAELDTCYKVHAEKKTWQDSFKTCGAEGGHLVVINNNIELDYLTDTLNQHNKSIDQLLSINYYIGLTYWYAPNQWVTVLGDDALELGIIEWRGTSFSNKLYKNMCRSLQTDGAMKTIDCSGRHPFICEKKTDSLKMKIASSELRK